MAFELYVDVTSGDGERIFVTHIFRGETEADARKVFQQHAAKCEFLTPAIAEGRIQEFLGQFDPADWPLGGDEDEDDEADEDDPEEDEDDEEK